MSSRTNAAPLAQARSGNWYWRTIQVLGAILAVRLISLWFNGTELFFDEAQYWLWGKEPAFGYFSKPPVLGWLIGTVTAVCGNSEFCVRLPSPLLHTATAFLLYLTGARLFGEKTGFWSALLYATLPAVSLSSTVISTDVPLLFLWALALYALIRLEREDRLQWAIVLGIALGAGLMAKYAMIYFLPCLLIYALLDANRPGVLARWKLWLALIIGGLCILPNLWWNAQNAFITASHTGENIGWGAGFPHMRAFAEFFFSQFAVFGPVLFGILLAAYVRLPLEGMNRRQLMLICFSAPVLAIIIFQSLMSKAYANWAAVAYIAATLLVADLLVNTVPAFWRRLTLPIHLGVFAVIATAVMFAGQLPLPPDRDPFERMRGAREIAEEVREKLGDRSYAALLTDDRRLSALLTYYLRDAEIAIKAWRYGPAPSDHYELTRPFQSEPTTPALYVTRFRNPAEIIQEFSDAEFLGEYQPSAGETRQVWIYALDGYEGTGGRQ